MATASFVTFVLIDEKNELNASNVFVCISLFNIIGIPLTELPQVIASAIQVIQLQYLQWLTNHHMHIHFLYFS